MCIRDSNIEENINSTTPLIGHSTGFRDLDKLTLGLQDGDLILVAGRPSMGKTAFGLSIAANFIENNIPAVFYSLEMSSRSVMYRLISILSKVELKKIFQAKELTDSDFEKIGKAVELLEKSNFFIDDTSALSPSEILSRSRKLKREQPELGLIVIDYLQLMKADQSNPSRVNEISEISRATKALAKELDIPVIALSQLNRASETRTNKVPILADMRDSGALEQDADHDEGECHAVSVGRINQAAELHRSEFFPFARCDLEVGGVSQFFFPRPSGITQVRRAWWAG